MVCLWYEIHQRYNKKKYTETEYIENFFSYELKNKKLIPLSRVARGI